MSEAVLLVVEGEVASPLNLTWQDLAAVESAHQIPDVSQVDPSRQGGAVTLEGVLKLAAVKPAAQYLTLHSSADDFHASVPIDSVRNRGFFIYRQNDDPLDPASGGPVRFYIPDFAACHSAEVDECANVKFVDRIELSVNQGFDNRPHDDDEHEALHK